MTDLLDDLQARGLINQMTSEPELREHLKNPVTLYCGFDPTADSLHIGSLVPLLCLRRFQLSGHKPLLLVGGATGLIGDPSFKAQERSLNSETIVSDWVECLQRQVSQFVTFESEGNAAEVVNNYTWTKDISVIEFLRDIGKHFSVNAMIQKESVKQRLSREDSGISFTEFSYMLLQSFDFSELANSHNCTLQIGGSDQWGNITGGIDLTRRRFKKQAFGLTLPLVTKSDGTKFGKTESGTIWLDANKTSPYAFYQFWINTSDADVYKFLKYFTFLDVKDIDLIEEEDKARNGKPEAQAILAKEVTRIVHGDEGFNSAYRISEALFKGQFSNLSETELEQLASDGMPCTDQPASEACTLIDALINTELASSRRAAREFLGANAVSLNGEKQKQEDLMLSTENALQGRFHIIKRGKKLYHMLKVSS